MPRPRRLRRVGFFPGTTYFKPSGVRLTELEDVVLTVDEFEAVRLKDFLQMDQEKSAKKMNISQPTFHRLVLCARKKMADALVNGKAIKIEGGMYKMATRPGRGTEARGRMGRGFGGPPDMCVCPSCRHQIPKARGTPCASVKCPKCGMVMTRG